MTEILAPVLAFLAIVNEAKKNIREIPAEMQARTAGRPTVSRPRVIWRTFRNVLLLWWKLRGPGARRRGAPSVASR